MGFIQSCFIRKNTSEIRKNLEELGYIIINEGTTTLDAHNYDGKGHHKSIEDGRAVITFYGDKYGVICSNHAKMKYFMRKMMLAGNMSAVLWLLMLSR